MLRTKRLAIQPWRDAHRQPFAELSADAEVMRYLMPIPTRTLADAWIDRQILHQTRHGFCFWAVEEAETGVFVGSVGLHHVGYDAPFTPAVEAGWRLARGFWGRGYGPESAAAALRYGFKTLNLAQIVANACVANANSQRVMHKLGMTRDPADDYDHPRVAEDSPLRRQVLYRLQREAWMARGDLG